jgi:type II secretory pathway component GspD/PulD (secretin)
MIRMRFGVLFAVLCVCAAAIGGPDDKPRGPKPKKEMESAKRQAQESLQTVIPLSSVSATVVANTVSHMLGLERQPNLPEVVVVGDAMSNSLVIRGTKESVEMVRALVAKLDRPPVMIRLEVAIGELASEKAAALQPDELRRRMDVLFQAEMTTLDNQPAFVRIGRREARISAVSMGPHGQSNSVTTENTGTKLSFTARHGADGSVTLQFDIDDSRMGPPDEGVVLSKPEKGEPIRMGSTETMSSQSTIRAADGQTVVVAAVSMKPKSGVQRWILLTPHIVPAGKVK